MQILVLLIVAHYVLAEATPQDVSAFENNNTSVFNTFAKTASARSNKESRLTNLAELPNPTPVLEQHHVANSKKHIKTHKSPETSRRRQKVTTQSVNGVTRRRLRHRKQSSYRYGSQKTESVLSPLQANLNETVEAVVIQIENSTSPPVYNVGQNITMKTSEDIKTKFFTQKPIIGRVPHNISTHSKSLTHNITTSLPFIDWSSSHVLHGDEFSKTEKLQAKEKESAMQQTSSYNTNRLNESASIEERIQGILQTTTVIYPVLEKEIQVANSVAARETRHTKHLSTASLFSEHKPSTVDTGRRTATKTKPQSTSSITNFNDDNNSHTPKQFSESQINFSDMDLNRNTQSDSSDPSLGTTRNTAEKPHPIVNKLLVDINQTDESVGTGEDNKNFTKMLSTNVSGGIISFTVLDTKQQDSVETTAGSTSKRRPLLHKVRHERKHKLGVSGAQDMPKQPKESTNESSSTDARHSTYNVYNFYGPVIITDKGLNSLSGAEFLRSIAADSSRNKLEEKKSNPGGSDPPRQIMTGGHLNYLNGQIRQGNGHNSLMSSFMGDSYGSDGTNSSEGNKALFSGHNTDIGAIHDFSGQPSLSSETSPSEKTDDLAQIGTNTSSTSARNSNGYDANATTESSSDKDYNQGVSDVKPVTDKYGNILDESGRLSADVYGNDPYYSGVGDSNNQNGQNLGNQVSEPSISISFDPPSSQTDNASALGTNYDGSATVDLGANYAGSATGSGYDGSAVGDSNIGVGSNYYGSSTGDTGQGGNFYGSSLGSNNMEHERGWKIRGSIRFGMQPDQTWRQPNMVPPAYDSSQWRHSAYPNPGVPSHSWTSTNFPPWPPHPGYWSPPYGHYGAPFQQGGYHHPYPGAYQG